MGKRKNTIITLFVLAWLTFFTYETVRYEYLNVIFGVALPKLKFLFPPAGWIMFYDVGEASGRAEVYGVRGDKIELIDPHQIFDNRWIGYDNIRRNILIHVLDKRTSVSFCRYLKRKFPQYEHFKVVWVIYPSETRQPGKKVMKVVYEC